MNKMTFYKIRAKYNLSIFLMKTLPSLINEKSVIDTKDKLRLYKYFAASSKKKQMREPTN